MKIASYDDHRVGVVEGDTLRDVTAALPAALDLLPQQRINWLIANWQEAAPRLQEEAVRAPALPLDRVRLLPANPAPPHVFAAPANYQKHIGELGERVVTKKGRSAREQGFFLKAPGSLVGHRGSIGLPKGSTRRFDHESELAVIVGRGGRNIPRGEAMRHVFGYACLIDATMRIEPGVAEEERSMRKSFAGFTPLGPWLVSADEVPDPQALDMFLDVNGRRMQTGNTATMIFPVAQCIAYVSRFITLHPGDLLITGTPPGVGEGQKPEKIFLKPGDEMHLGITGLGEQRQRCIAWSHAGV